MKNSVNQLTEKTFMFESLPPNRSPIKEEKLENQDKHNSLYSFQNNVNQSKEENRKYSSTLQKIRTIAATMSIFVFVSTYISVRKYDCNCMTCNVVVRVY